MESDEQERPAWQRIAGWASATAALLFVVVGAVFLQPSGDRSIEVSKPFDAGLGLDAVSELDDPGDATAEAAMADELDAGGDGADVELADAADGAVDDSPPADLSFVDDGELPPPLVDASPLEAPDLEPDGPDATAGDAAAGDDAASPDAAADEAPAAEVPAASAEGGYTDSFDAVGPPWTALAGLWSGSGGRFVQQDTDGFDLIAQLELDMPEAYRLSVVIAPMSGPLSAGVLIGQQTPGERAGAWLIDFSDDGTFVRLGRYIDTDAAYEYVEGLAVPDGFDPAGTHAISILVEPTDTTVFLDGEFFTTFQPAPAGRVGLVTNGAATAFDDFVIEPL